MGWLGCWFVPLSLALAPLFTEPIEANNLCPGALDPNSVLSEVPDGTTDTLLVNRCIAREFQ